MMFTLGVLTTGLLALAALPAIWRRAVRLSTARLSRLVPLSAEEIAAERDHIRAAHAVELRRTEQKLERVDAARAALLSEEGRLSTRIVALEQEGSLARERIGILEAEAKDLRWDLNQAWANDGAAALALHAATELAQKRWLEAAVLERDKQKLEQRVDQDRGSLAALETRLLGANTRNEDLGQDLAALRRELDRAGERLSAIETERDGARAAAGTIAAHRDDLALRLESRDHEVQTLTHELDFMREQAASAERRSTDSNQAAEKLQTRIDAILAAQASSAEAAREEDRSKIAVMEELRADKAALAVALAAARLDAAPGGNRAVAGQSHTAPSTREGAPGSNAEPQSPSGQAEFADISKPTPASPP